jgi:23S rRNA-/tRNA-specific pseudouridylate synthase
MARIEDVKVLFRNHELLVIDKPFDVAMDGDRPDLTVEKWVHATQQEYLAEPLHIGNLVTTGNGNRGVAQKSLKFVHQLDYATSGVLCLAFSRDMAARLSHCFHMRYTKKWYLAVVHGHFDPSLFTQTPFAPDLLVRPGCGDDACGHNGAALIEGAISEDTSDAEGFRMCIDPEKGKSAKTMVQILEQGTLSGYPDVPVTKVLLQPETGRRHQLRVHLLSLGHPIVGDATYCPLLGYTAGCSRHSPALRPEDSRANEVPPTAAAAAAVGGGAPLARMCLHAWKIKFFETIEDAGSRNERTTAKKKRRRETRGFEERTGCSGSTSMTTAEAHGDEKQPDGTLFQSDDPFVGLVTPSGGEEARSHE